MSNYYKKHVITKIGHPDIHGKQNHQIKVTYLKDQLTYEDTKFAAKGLIEYFIQAD